MTVPATDSRAGPFPGTGAIVPLPFEFKVFAQEDVLVTRTDVDGFESTLVVGVDYTVTLNPDQDADPGGEVTPTVAPAVGEFTTLTSGLEYEQPIDLVTGGKFRAQTVEDGLDRATMLIKQLKEQSDRTLHLPISAEADVALPVPEANALLGWNQTADALQNVDPTTLATIVAFGTGVVDIFSGDGTSTDFTLSTNPGALANLHVSIAAADQRPGIDFTWAGGTTVHFTTPPPVGLDNILFQYMQGLPQGYSTDDQVGVQQPYAGAKARTQHDKNTDYVTLLDFDGVDPTGSTSSVAAFTAAITTLPASGGTIVVPAGIYLIDSTVVLNKRLTLRGAGSAEMANDTAPTVFRKPATLNAPAFRLTTPSITMSDFTLQGVAGNGGDGISVEHARCTLRDCSVFGMGRDGVRVGTDAGVNANHWRLENVVASNNGRYGANLSDKVYPTLPDANGGVLSGGLYQSNGVDGIHVGNAQLNTFVGAVCEANAGNGMEFGDGGSHNSVFGGDYEANTANQIALVANTTRNLFVGCVVQGATTDSGVANQWFACSSSAYENGIKLANVNSTLPVVLDWYDEGLPFTPTITFATPGNLAVTYSAQVGNARRVGNMVEATFSITTSSFTHTTAAGNLRIAGLPFASVNVANEFHAGSLIYQGITDANHPQQTPIVLPNTNYIELRGSGSGVANGSTGVGQMPTGGSVILIGKVTYRVA